LKVMRRGKEGKVQGDGKGYVFGKLVGREPMFLRPLEF